MDNSKIMQIADIHPLVNFANYFNLDAESVWGPRRIPDYELILIRRGKFRYEMSGADPRDLEEGMVLLILPGIEHYLYSCLPGGAISCIHCLPLSGPKGVALFCPISPTPQTITDVSSDFALMDELFRRCTALYEGYGPYNEELAGTVCREIWLYCASRWQDGTDPLSIRMERMLQFINENIQRPLSRKDLADEFNLAPEYVNALFKKELGFSPTYCIQREKVLQACNFLLQGDCSVTEAAYRCGFRDPLYFSRVFKKILGLPPKTLRSHFLAVQE
ncbi:MULTISPECIES: AraC family transcriptional regulator [unclassified Oceanispirochaeta]|uniref:helix-turn-helix domain-containing protein n=1 Tax=unclassified Oceanispirochaeta TaxID=2635722 RepID=UPI000E098B7F|nr:MULTISPECIES: helix-turn-helix domain-containing protein [unclassified Oceanispirochaeta]MBF9017943.1 helix-turn-helix domain-containing protein [Oceanispirochaeta sp. M2]NPD74454.1 helix-turn-helix transcriptional regulator [Oceanispirochaeta sp. M1]RDG29663.1 AraC family transcriptional regulator [Oceanispirochaeta sp. M1]